METEKLYYEDSYRRSFRARVVRCTEEKAGWEVVLDRTAFYPEGGGQPGDRGVLNTVNVKDTHEKEGEILHLTDAPLPVGEWVSGGIHWPLRFSRMQEHSGEHLVSGLIHRHFGLDNVGFHMGSDCVTLDLNGELTAAELLLMERLANEAVWKDLPVDIYYPSSDELSKLDYRSKKELTGAVRIVRVPGYDVCACCGTHVKRTGEIGLVKLTGVLRYKGGVRVNMVCGSRALLDYGQKEAGVGAVSALLSAKPQEIAGAVERLLRSEAECRQELVAVRRELLAEKAAQIPAGEHALCVFEAGLKPDDLRTYCLLLKDKAPLTAVFSGGEGRYQYALTNGEDARPAGKALNAALHGRGGGKGDLVQGSVEADREAIETYFAALS